MINSRGRSGWQKLSCRSAFFGAWMALGVHLLVGNPIALAQEPAVDEEDAGQGPTTETTEEASGEEASGAPIGLFGSFSEEDPPENEDSDVTSLPSTPGTHNAIDVGNLGGLNTRALGLMDETNGGFSPQMWSGTRRDVVEGLLNDLPDKTISPIVQSLTRRLLLSRAQDPLSAEDSSSILALRLAKLYDLGLIDEALALSRQDLSTTKDPNVLKVGSKIHLLHQDVQSACANAALTRSLSEDVFWLKLRAVCYALAKDPASARMSAELLLDDNHQDEAYFTLLWNAIDDIGLTVDKIDRANALHLILLRMNHLPLPSSSIANARVPVQLRVADTGVAGGAPADLVAVRLPAAEKAVEAGVFGVDRLRVLYREVTLQSSERLQLIDEAYENASIRVRAALFQEIDDAVLEGQKARLIKIALDVGSISGTKGVAERVFGHMIEQLTPDKSLVIYAQSFLPVLIANGSYDKAYSWLDLLEKQHRSTGATGPSDDVLAYRAMLQLIHPYEDGRLAWDAMQRLGLARSDRAFYRAALEVRLFDTLGLEVSNEAKMQLLARPVEGRGQMPESGVLSGLDVAARSGRLGETVLYALVALGEGGPSEAPAAVLVKVVSGLSRVGLHQEAKRVAIESLLGAT